MHQTARSFRPTTCGANEDDMELHKHRRRRHLNAKETLQLRYLAGIDLRFEPDETTIQAIHATLHATGHVVVVVVDSSL